MKSKRVLAKVIDAIIFLFLSGIFCGVAYVVADIVMANYNLVETMANFMVDLSALSPQAMIEYVKENHETFFIFMSLTFIAMIIFSVLYFGVIGYLVEGSLGKYVLKLSIRNSHIDEVSDSGLKKKVNMLVLAAREPLMQLQVISFTFFVIAYFFPELPLINIFNILYLIMFFTNHDFWNKIFKVKIDTL